MFVGEGHSGYSYIRLPQLVDRCGLVDNIRPRDVDKVLAILDERIPLTPGEEAELRRAIAIVEAAQRARTEESRLCLLLGILNWKEMPDLREDTRQALQYVEDAYGRLRETINKENEHGA